jgi:hypothetical protein
VAAPSRRREGPDPSAKDVNDAHRLARANAETAVEHAVRCGKLLQKIKRELPHGSFQAWIEKHCDFTDKQARRYIKASTKVGLAAQIGSLTHLLGEVRTPKIGLTIDKKASEKTQVVDSTGTKTDARVRFDYDKSSAKKATPPESSAARKSVTTTADTESEMPSVEEIEDLEARTDIEWAASITKLLESDDRLAAAAVEIKRQSAEIAQLKISRDGFMTGKSSALQLLKTEQRKVAALERKLKSAQSELENLRERIAIQEAG